MQWGNSSPQLILIIAELSMEEFTQGIQTYFSHKASLKNPKKKATPLLIPYGRFSIRKPFIQSPYYPNYLENGCFCGINKKLLETSASVQPAQSSATPKKAGQASTPVKQSICQLLQRQRIEPQAQAFHRNARLVNPPQEKGKERKVQSNSETASEGVVGIGVRALLLKKNLVLLKGGQCTRWSSSGLPYIGSKHSCIDLRKKQRAHWLRLDQHLSTNARRPDWISPPVTFSGKDLLASLELEPNPECSLRMMNYCFQELPKVTSVQTITAGSTPSTNQQLKLQLSPLSSEITPIQRPFLAMSSKILEQEDGPSAGSNTGQVYKEKGDSDYAASGSAKHSSESDDAKFTEALRDVCCICVSKQPTSSLNLDGMIVTHELLVADSSICTVYDPNQNTTESIYSDVTYQMAGWKGLTQIWRTLKMLTFLGVDRTTRFKPIPESERHATPELKLWNTSPE
ncbi:hypothetical protein Tco_1532814 [Tanacetum coccineum]